MDDCGDVALGLPVAVLEGGVQSACMKKRLETVPWEQLAGKDQFVTRLSDRCRSAIT